MQIVSPQWPRAFMAPIKKAVLSFCKFTLLSVCTVIKNILNVRHIFTFDTKWNSCLCIVFMAPRVFGEQSLFGYQQTNPPPLPSLCAPVPTKINTF